jgi:hypothetical protein
MEFERRGLFSARGNLFRKSVQRRAADRKPPL